MYNSIIATSKNNCNLDVMTYAQQNPQPIRERLTAHLPSISILIGLSNDVINPAAHT